jgi:hypothetical protein
MTKHDDFDIIPDSTSGKRQTPPGAPNRPDNNNGQGNSALRIALWIVVGLFAVAVGLAITQLTDRLGEPATPAATPAILPTAGVNLIATLVADATLTAQPTASVMSTPQPTVATAAPVVLRATATPLPCPIPAAAQFGDLYRPELGCARSGTALVWSAWETFERGAMLWRSDTNLAYLFDGATARWEPVVQGWDGQSLPSRGVPPAGLLAPERGFGYVWAIRDDVFDRLGWATGRELGFCALVQEFERGFLLEGAAVDDCGNGLFNSVFDPAWRPVRIAASGGTGQWWGTAASGTGLLAVTPAATRLVQGRPTANGLTLAPAAGAITLDGQFNEWSQNWQPIDTLVQGAEFFTGAQDLAADFQTQWSSDGVWLAVRVTDDLYRPGPEGTDQWQGDGIEINFDANLLVDFSDSGANEDDFQVGLAPGVGLYGLRSYRWLPFALEASIQPAGIVTAAPGGYQMETLLPWWVFNVQAGTITGQESFGFNIAVNDNDGETPAQQTVLSLSPVRTTYNDPTQWGTLILKP